MRNAIVKAVVDVIYTTTHVMEIAAAYIEHYGSK